MKHLIYTLFLLGIILSSCIKPEVLPNDYYSCDLPFADSSLTHQNASSYQNIIDRAQKLGAVGVSVMVKDDHGVWLGTSGMADIANQVKLKPCQPMFIASITKVFTASMIYTFIDEGRLSMDDFVHDWIDETTLEGLENADQAQIKHLLSHTSGIPDYYRTSYDMMRLNSYSNNLSHEEILEYAKKNKATNKLGEKYWYSNTNYLLLGMIMEKVSGTKLRQLFDSKIFQPLQLESAVYGGDNPIPKGAVKGYIDIYGDGKFVESTFLLNDELNTADGGISITAYETGLFFEKLLKGNVISGSSLTKMLNSFELQDGWWNPLYCTMHGAYGIEKFLTPNGTAYGYTGSVMGFSSLVQYFPDSDKTFVMIINSSTYDEAVQEEIYNSCMELMFD